MASLVSWLDPRAAREVTALRGQLSGLQQQLATFTQQQQLSAQQQAAQQAQAFSEAKAADGTPLRPHFAAVRQEMARLIGAGVALLFAPRTGRETRADITRRARAAQDRVRDVAEGVTEQVVDRFEGARARIEEQIESARTVIVAKKDQVTRAMEAGREAAYQARTDLERRLAETKAAYTAGANVARAGRPTAPVSSNGDEDADA